MSRFVASRFAFHIVVAVLLFVPHCFGSRLSPAPYYFGLPRIHSGDEPHMLLFLNSLLKDGDLSLANNYASVHKGSEQAGFLFRKARLNHHTIWFKGEQRIHWFELYEIEEPSWTMGPDGFYVPTLRADANLDHLPDIERPYNSPGLAVFLRPFLYLFRNTPYVESLATLCSAIMVVIASIFWRRLASALTDDQRTVNLGVALAFLGTPAWHYGRSLFSEPYLMCFVIGAYAFAFVRPRLVLAGALIGVAIFIKPVAVLMGLPIGLYFLVKKDLRSALLFGLPATVGVALVLNQNRVLYGGFFHSSNEFAFGSALYGTLNILAYPTRGLLTTATIALAAVAGWGDVLRRSRGLASVLVACFIFFLVACLNRAWAGGYAYSIRFLVPLLPLFCLGLVPLFEPEQFRGRARGFLIAAGAFSILVNFLAAVQYWRAFNNHPFVYLIPNTDFGG